MEAISGLVDFVAANYVYFTLVELTQIASFESPADKHKRIKAKQNDLETLFPFDS